MKTTLSPAEQMLIQAISVKKKSVKYALKTDAKLPTYIRNIIIMSLSITTAPTDDRHSWYFLEFSYKITAAVSSYRYRKLIEEAAI